jgi:serine/threonine protein kinase/WD40 repeat protein
MPRRHTPSLQPSPLQWQRTRLIFNALQTSTELRCRQPPLLCPEGLRLHDLPPDPRELLDRARQVEAVQAAGDDPARTDDLTPPGWPARTIGPYKLLQHLGEGGMGTVFLAEQQQPVRRTVALKVIKPGLDGALVLARFEAERQALALMDHPHIARVLDGGTTPDGRPYFVMELVNGLPITRFCDEHRLSPRQRLELFVPVCQAVQHAHQKGIIHRDLKPSNVLVALYDDKPVPKVIDFGVAKAAGQKLTEHTLFTALGAVVGTLEYMSPEQARLNQLDVDTRSDVYTLGVLLYELLTGSTPLERARLRRAAVDEALRWIREEEPPPPSARLSQSGLALADISARRRTEPQKLSRLLRGELDWIAMKCLEKDRARRYDSAAGLARDLQRHLADEPVEAGPPSAGYRLRKLARRYKAVLALGAAFALLLVAGAGVSAWQAARALEAETEAGQQRDAALANEAKARDAAAAARKERDVAQQARDAAQDAREKLQRALYGAQFNLIPAAWEANNVRRVLDLLEQVRPEPGQHDLRGFEWHYWNRLCHSELRTLHVHRLEALSADGSRLVTFDGDGYRRSGLFKVWDLAAERQVFTLPLTWPENTQHSLALSRDGKRLALTIYAQERPFLSKEELNTPMAEGRLVIWDVGSGKELLARPGYFTRPSALSPDGGRVVVGVAATPKAVAWKDSHWKVWDAASGKEVVALAPPNAQWENVHKLEFTPDGSRLFALAQPFDPTDAPRKCHHLFWDAASGACTMAAFEEKDAPLQHCFSPDGSRLALREISSQTGTRTSVRDLQSGKTLFSYPSGPWWPQPQGGALVFSPDGKLLAMGQMGVQVRDAATGEVLLTFKGHTAPVYAVAFSADGSRLIAIDLAGTLKEWDVRAALAPLEHLIVFHRAATGPAFLGTAPPDGFFALSPAGDRQAVFHPRSSKAAGSAEVSVRDAAGMEVLPFREHTTAVWHAYFSPDGRHLVSEDDGGEFKLWDAATGAVRLSRKWGRRQRGTPSDMTFSADGRRAALPEPDGGASVWELTPLREVFRTPKEDWGCCLSADGLRLVSQGILADGPPGNKEHGGPVGEGPAPDAQLPWGSRLWDVTNGKVLLTILGGRSLGFSPDGKFLALAVSAIDDAFKDTGMLVTHVKIWHAATGAELLTVKDVEGSSNTPLLRFSPDGKLLAVPARSGTEIALWDLTTGKVVHRLQGHNGRVTDVDFSPDGKRLASLAEAAEVKLWDTAIGNELLNLPLPKTLVPLQYVAFSADGSRLLASSIWLLAPEYGESTGKVWDATPLPGQGAASGKTLR